MLKLNGYFLDDPVETRRRVVGFVGGDYGVDYVIRHMLSVGEFVEVVLDDVYAVWGECFSKDDLDEYNALKSLWDEGKL